VCFLTPLRCCRPCPARVPAYFLDFETIQFAVPSGKARAPISKSLPISLHTLVEPGRLSHKAFLDLSCDDPSESLARALIAACGKSGHIRV